MIRGDEYISSGRVLRDLTAAEKPFTTLCARIFAGRNVMNRFDVTRMLTVGAGALLFSAFVAVPGAAAKWRYTRTGSPTDVAVVPRTGYALMGGGAKQDPAFHFLCERTNGGDFLILRANTDDEYAQGVNKEIFAMCPLN